MLMDPALHHCQAPQPGNLLFVHVAVLVLCPWVLNPVHASGAWLEQQQGPTVQQFIHCFAFVSLLFPVDDIGYFHKNSKWMTPGTNIVSVLPTVRAYRLAITSVRRPWQADCVQLACFDLLLDMPAEHNEAAAARTASQQVSMPSPACRCPAHPLMRSPALLCCRHCGHSLSMRANLCVYGLFCLFHLQQKTMLCLLRVTVRGLPPAAIHLLWMADLMCTRMWLSGEQRCSPAVSPNQGPQRTH